MSYKPSHLQVIGDLSYPNIDWEAESSQDPETHSSHPFFEALRDLFLHQFVTRLTRYREKETSNILDLVLSTEDDIISGIKYLPGLGSSDHVCMVLDLTCSKEVRSDDIRPKYAYYSGNFDKLRILGSKAKWEQSYDMYLESQYKFFCREMGRLLSECTPLIQPQNQEMSALHHQGVTAGCKGQGQLEVHY